jgi:hypothetical protein
MGEWSIAPPFLTGRYTYGEKSSVTQWIGGWVDPRASLKAVEEKMLSLLGFESWATSPEPVATPTELSQLIIK